MRVRRLDATPAPTPILSHVGRVTPTKNAADHTIPLITAATQATRTDPFQSGFLIELPSAGELLVTGDIHGNAGNLQRIVQVADLGRCPGRHLVLQELVHELQAVDDVCRSYRLVEIAAQLKCAYPKQVHILLGNHEFAECLGLEIGKRGRELNAAFADGLRAAYGESWEEVKEAYHEFWTSCPLAVHTSNGLFVSHSTPHLDRMNGLTLEYLRTATVADAFRRDGPVFSLLWDRDYRPQTAEAFAQRMQAEVLLVGHTACADGMQVPNKRHIILDSKDFEGRYVLLPLDRELDQRRVLAYVQRLYR
jgi:hypothetical protein